jgi:hypothetical protein
MVIWEGWRQGVVSEVSRYSSGLTAFWADARLRRFCAWDLGLEVLSAFIRARG